MTEITRTQWGEALRVHEGTLWSSDTQGSALISAGAERVTRRQLGSPVNGSWFLPDGRMVVARWNEKRLEVFDGESFSPYADLSALVQEALGDMAGTPDGRLYVDDMGKDPHSGEPVGRILLVESDGSASVAAEGLRFPNGIAILGDVLVVAETHGTCLSAFDIGPGGRLASRRVWCDLATVLGEAYRPDGIWPAPDGSIWVAATAGEAFVRVREAEVLDRIDVPGEFAISCCLDGDDLYISASRSTDPQLDLVSEAIPQRKITGRIARVDLIHRGTEKKAEE